MKHTKYFVEGYPRPQFVKPNWKSLDGKWDFAFDDEVVGIKQKWFNEFPKDLEINVPFSYHTKLSGIERIEEHNVVWYHKDVKYDDNLDGKCLLLNFEGSDYFTKVWVNGEFVGEHRGGYTRFSLDITDQVVACNGFASIVVRCEDYKDATQPRGKQTWLKEPFGCWYHETNGLWKSVWSEVVSEIHLTSAKITPCFDEYNIEFELNLNRYVEGHYAKIEITYGDNLISESIIKLVRKTSNVKVDLNNDFDGFRVHYWTPECPNIYDLKITLLKNSDVVEEIGSYFGFRSFHANKNCLLLNNNPVYLKLVLHQGYYRDGGLSAPNTEALLNDLKLAKDLGFNGIRMHQKIEDERFYYYADVLGMMIWCEMPSPYEFKDTTIDNLMVEWLDVVKQNYNHPSICVWVPINESWGVPRIVFDSTNQHLAESLYHVTKAYDKYRPTISNDGWEHVTSDIITLHNYTQSAEELYHFYADLLDMLNGNYRVEYTQTRLPFANGYKYNGQPVVLSEFAGIGYQNGSDEGWGYGDKVKSSEAYVNRLASLVAAVRKIDGICGFCITQLSDVEQEINGLLDYDREPKADFEKLAKAIKS